jgi:PAS domain S-box-containing protein
LFLFVPTGTPTWFLGTCFVNDSLKALLSAWLLRRVSPAGAWVDRLGGFARYFLIAVLVVPALSAVGGAATRVYIGDDFGVAWRSWFFGDALASLVLTPLLYCVLRDSHRLSWRSASRCIEGGLASAGLLLAGYLVFHREYETLGRPPFLLYLPAPFFLWSAVRFGPLGASWTLTLMGFLSIWGTSAGRGPFYTESAGDSMLSIQLFLFSVSCPFMFLSIISRQQHQTEVVLRESEGRFRSLADTAPVMIWVSDVAARFTFVNRPFLDFIGGTFDNQLGGEWIDRLHPEDRDGCKRQCVAAFASRSSFTTEYRLLRKDGTYRWLFASAVPRYASDGAFLGYIGSCVDISDRKEVEEKLRQVSAQLINAQESERARIGQELHDDLAQRALALSLGLINLERTCRAGADTEGEFAKLEETAREMSRDIARLSHELRPAALEKLGLALALRTVCEQTSTPDRVVRFEHQEELPLLTETAKVALYRMTQEALRNALTHSGASDIRVDLSASSIAVSLSIRDNGCGFAPAVMREPRLGLSGMFERVKQAGGRLNITSNPGQGTCITATIPAAKTMAAGS